MIDEMIENVLTDEQIRWFRSRYKKGALPPKEDLIELYYKYKLSQRAIAKIYNVQRSCVHYWFSRYGIKGRNLSEAIHISEKRIGNIKFKRKIKDFISTVNFKEFVDFIDGIILGDGYISKPSKKENSFLGIAQKYERIEWLESIKERLQEYRIKCKIHDYVARGGVVNKEIHMCMLNTQRHPIFTLMRLRWYPENEKSVPTDVSLGQLCLSQWYMGDGSLIVLEGRRYITFNTQNFDYIDCQYLVMELNRMYNLNAYVALNKGYIIRIGNKSAVYRFLRLTKKYMVECFKYKWRLLPEIGGDK